MTTKEKKGFAAALIGGTLWGCSGVSGQFLFDKYGVGAEWLTAVRMLSSGALLTGVCLARTPAAYAGLFRSRRDCLSLLLFAFLGLLFSQLTYLKAIAASNAATATIMQYVGPVLIVGVVCCRERRAPTLREAGAAILALGGVYLLATGGDWRDMILSRAGLCWGLLAAVALVFYTLLPTRLMARWGSLPVTGAGLCVGGLAMGLFTRFWQQMPALDPAGWGALGVTCLLGTACAYSLYLYGVKEAGAMKAGLLACSEPVSSAVAMTLFLKVPMTAADVIGFLMILSTIFLLAKNKEGGA